ncbi:hypothetical protein V8E52_007100 [Russula decolorans]
MPLPVAINGTIALQGPTRQGDAPQPLTKRAMIIRMSEQTLEALAAYPAHPPLQFEFGDTPGIHIESTFFPMRGVQESTPHELYLRSALASKVNAPLKLYADIAGKFHVERELNGKAESKVQQSTADARKTKTERRIVLLDNPPPHTSSTTKTKSSAPAKKRKPVVSAPIAATVKRVPVRVKNEGSSAARGPSPPHSLPSSQSSPVPPAIRAQMIHLLAKGPRTKDDVLTQVGGPDASQSLRVQLNELLVTIAERERTKAAAGQPLYTLLRESWKEVRPYEFAGLTDSERRKMWLQARQSLYSLGIPETDPAWDHVRTQPGSTGTGLSKAAAGPKRATGTVNAERKKNTGSTSKPLVEAKDEGVRPSQAAKVREEARSMKAVPMRDDNPPPRRPPGASGLKNAREVAPTQSQAQGPSKKTESKKTGLTDARAKLGGSSKPNGRSGPTTHIPASSYERELEKERPTHPTKKEREDVSDLDREKGKAAAVHKAKRRRDDMTKRRKVLDDDRPYKPGGGGGGGTKARERDRDKELDGGKTRDRDPPHVAKRPRDSDWGSPDPPPPRKSTVREHDRQREREPDRSVSPPRRIKREYSLSPALHNSPLPRATTKRADSPPRHSVKRESSPRLRGHSRRDVSPLAPQTSKRATSPSRSQNRPRDRHRETSTNGGSTSRRRRSPIYTSSEDEQQNVPVRRNAPSSVTSSSSSREAVRTQSHASHPPPPTVPYPKDREALEARYRSGYRNYIAVYYKLLDERAKIQDALEDFGREGSVGSDRDVEMMDEEGLRELKGQYTAWTRELEGIRNACSAEAERMDIKA